MKWLTMANDWMGDLPLPRGAGEGRGEGTFGGLAGFHAPPLTPALSPSEGARGNGIQPVV